MDRKVGEKAVVGDAWEGKSSESCAWQFLIPRFDSDKSSINFVLDCNETASIVLRSVFRLIGVVVHSPI